MAGQAAAGNSLAWSQRQVNIALGFALAAAAEQRIASCPMEGFDSSGVAKILDLPEGLVPTAYLAVGRSHPDEKVGTGGHPQWRYPVEEVVKFD